MELRKEYESIAQQFASSIYDCTGLGEAHDTVRNAVTACQELADRPPRELTDAEIERCLLKEYGLGITVTKRDIAAGRIVIEAHIAKQREPQVVKFRAARRADTDRIEMFPSDFVFTSAMWEWLDADGKPQEIEVRT